VREDLANFASALLGLLRTFHGCTVFEVNREAMVACPSPDAGGYLNGKWFEEWLWLRIRDQLADTEAEVRLGLGVILSVSLDHGRKDFDFDVAIHANDQLHVIECKVSQTHQGDEINKLSRAKSVVLGPFGKAWLVRAPSLDAAAKGYEQAGRAELILAARKAELEAMLNSVRRAVL
jgi:hypothetical protein